MRTISLTAACLLAVHGIASAEDWASFRGPQTNGISSDKNVPLEWGADQNLAWKLKLPGKGFSSPIVVGDAVFVTTYTGGEGDLSELERTLVKIDRKTGKQVWAKSVAGLLPEFRPMGSFAYHGYASSTPVSDGKIVVVQYGSTGIIAYDMDGTQLWQTSVGTETASKFGSSSSPTLYKEMVIVAAGCESGSIIALDKTTGKEIWKSPAASMEACYSTPIVTKDADGEDVILISVPYEVWAMYPKTGKLKWWVTTEVDSSACTTLILNDGIGYAVGGRTGGRTAFKLGGDGDMTEKNVLWSKRGGTYVPSPVYKDGKLFWVSDRGIATCVDAKTGESLSTERISGQFYASPILVDDKMIVVSRYTGTYIIEANEELSVVGTNTLSDESDSSASPAVTNGQLFIRSDEYLYCIGK